MSSIMSQIRQRPAHSLQAADKHLEDFKSSVTDATDAGVGAFELYLDDDRYSVPTLQLIAARDEAEAVKTAEKRLSESAHYSGIEIWQGGRRVAVLGSATPRAR